MCTFYLFTLVLVFVESVSCHYDDYSNGYFYEKPLPQDVMVDVINNFGVELLEAHNENNNNNIALSPYGATSVLIALGEGLRGYAVQEIQEAAHIPQDVSVIRVGLRDIHRHLKSYFIPKEGFLAGLTLNNERVQLNEEYKEILRFYGFDLDSFNIPLYPDIFETSTAMTLNVTGGDLTTTENNFIPTQTETSDGTTEVSGEVTEKTTSVVTESTESMATSENGDTTTQKNDVTTQKDDKTTQKVDISKNEDVTTEKGGVTEKVTTTQKSDVTTENVVTEKTTRIQTRSTDSIIQTTDLITSTLLPEISSPEMILLRDDETTKADVEMETTLKLETSTNPPITSTQEIKITTTPTKTPRELTTIPIELITMPKSTRPTKQLTTTSKIDSTEILNVVTTTENFKDVTSEKLDITERTTRIQTRSTDSIIKSTNLMTSTFIPETTFFKEDETTTFSNEEMSTFSNKGTTLSKGDKTTNLNIETTQQSITSTFPTTTQEISFTSSPLTTQTESTTLKIDTTAVPTEISTTEKSLELTTETQTQTESILETNFDQTTLNLEDATKDNSIDLSTTEEIGKKKRNSRSIVDYIIARHYDNNLYKTNHHHPFNNIYVPNENPTFLIYGTTREPNINFMRYDAVLPVAFLPLLNAVALSFPLDSKEYYLLLILPVEETGIDKLIHNVAHTMKLRDIITSLRYAHVRALIPSFMLKGYVVLTPSLQKLGIQRIFEPRRTDFSLMTNEKDVYVTNIEQAVTVTIRNYVDADNLPNYRNLQRARPVLFQADHPFLYFVMDAQIHVALMAGKIVNPLNSRIR